MATPELQADGRGEGTPAEPTQTASIATPAIKDEVDAKSTITIDEKPPIDSDADTSSSSCGSSCSCCSSSEDSGDEVDKYKTEDVPGIGSRAPSPTHSNRSESLTLEGREVKSESEDETKPQANQRSARRGNPDDRLWPKDYIIKADVPDAKTAQHKLAGHIDHVYEISSGQQSGVSLLVKAAATDRHILDYGSILCTEDGDPLGGIAEVLGLASEPIYFLAFEDKAEVEKFALQPGQPVHYYTKFAEYVFPDKLRDAEENTDGDAHNEDSTQDATSANPLRRRRNQAHPSAGLEHGDEAVFSDDEKEKWYKTRGKKGHKGGVREMIKIELEGPRDAPPRHSFERNNRPRYSPVPQDPPTYPSYLDYDETRVSTPGFHPPPPRPPPTSHQTFTQYRPPNYGTYGAIPPPPPPPPSMSIPPPPPTWMPWPQQGYPYPLQQGYPGPQQFPGPPQQGYPHQYGGMPWPPAPWGGYGRGDGYTRGRGGYGRGGDHSGRGNGGTGRGGEDWGCGPGGGLPY